MPKSSNYGKTTVPVIDSAFNMIKQQEEWIMKAVHIIALMVLLVTDVFQLPGYAALTNAEKEQKAWEQRERAQEVLNNIKQGKPVSYTVLFDTFRADKLDQKRPYGFGVDNFFGALAMMEQAGHAGASNPTLLLDKTLKGLGENEYDRDSLKVILFYFGRAGLRNPPVIKAYRKLYDRTEDEDEIGTMTLVLWFCQDKEIQTVFRDMAKKETDPEEREYYREMFKHRDFADIEVETFRVENCMDVEILWAEYFVHKDRRAIEKIADQVTGGDGGLERAIISVEAGSSLAQRGGWFDEVQAVCRARQAAAVGTDREIWDDILSRMKPLGNGAENVWCPTDRIPLDGKIGRAMACEAIFPKKDHGKPDVLGAYGLDGGNVTHTRKILNQWWFEGGRFELLSTVEWLAKKGHRKSFNERTEQIIHLSEPQRRLFISKQHLLSEPKWRIVCEYGPKLGDKSILAWDLSRVPMLGRFGYEAQYLSPAEVYRLAIPAAITLQETFDSWEDYGENIWIGRWYWRAREEDRDKAKAAVEALLTEADSPWKKYAWDMEMK